MLPKQEVKTCSKSPRDPRTTTPNHGLIRPPWDWFQCARCKADGFRQTDHHPLYRYSGEHLDGISGLCASPDQGLVAINSITNRDGVAVSTSRYTHVPKVLTVETAGVQPDSAVAVQ